MSQQMSLFPTKDGSEEKAALFEGDGNAIDEVFSAAHRFRSSREYLHMLQVIGRFPNYSAFNGFLLFIQNPELTYREHRLEDKYTAMVHELGQIFCGHRGIDRNAW